MMRRTRIILVVLVCAVVVLLVYLLFGGKESEEAEVSTVVSPVVVPDFRFPDASGKEVVLSQVEARVRVVNFWASWSPYSKDELPALVELTRAFGDDIAVVALNRDTNPEDGRAFLASLGLGDELLFAYDQADTYFLEVGGYNMPETIFVAPDGEVLAHVHGPMTYDAMRKTLTGLLDTQTSE